MRRYKNKNGNSGVAAYKIGADFVAVIFTGNDPVYRYTYQSAGKKHIEAMKALAQKGTGLSTYISQHVHDKFVP